MLKQQQTGLKLIEYVEEANSEKEARQQLEYLKTHPCVDCGEHDPIVLEFDHVRGTKINCVSVGVKDSWSVEKLTEEINKCEVRCANCHKIMTDTRRKHKIIY